MHKSKNLRKKMFFICLIYYLIDFLLDSIKDKCILWLILYIKPSGKGVKELHRKEGLYMPNDMINLEFLNSI